MVGFTPAWILILALGAEAAAARPGALPADSQPAFRPSRAQPDQPRVCTARERRNQDIRGLFKERQLAYPAHQVLLRIFKREKTLELWVRPRHQKQFVRLKSYEICTLSGELGPKRRRGDLQVPEGFYQITAFNPESAYLLSMQVSYPNRSDRIRGHPGNPGGNISIHGSCVTIGCIPLTDRFIEELYLICLDSHWRYGNRPLVHIFPRRLDVEGRQWLIEKYGDRPELLLFWEELRPGFERFEATQIPAPFVILEDGRYRFPN